jgi:hypothetical protein
MPTVAVNVLLRRIGMRRDDGEIAQLHLRTEQRLEKPNQERVRVRLRPAERAGHAKYDVVAGIPDHEEPGRRRFGRFRLHRRQIHPAKPRDKFAMHVLDHGGRKRATQQHAAMLAERGVRGGCGLGRQCPSRGLARRDGNDQIHRRPLAE